MRRVIICKLRGTCSYSTSRTTEFSVKINSVHEAVNIPNTPSSRWSNCNTWDLGLTINNCMTHISSRKSFHKKICSQICVQLCWSSLSLLARSPLGWPLLFLLTEQITSSGTWVFMSCHKKWVSYQITSFTPPLRCNFRTCISTSILKDMTEGKNTEINCFLQPQLAIHLHYSEASTWRLYLSPTTK